MGIAVSGCGTEQHQAITPPETVGNVSLVVARETTVADWLDAVGTVRAAQTFQIASQATGNILEIRAHEGDRVAAGQVLAVIDDLQPRATVDQSAAALAAAQKELAAADSDSALAGATLKRYEQLYNRKSVSPQEFDEVKARFQSSEAHREMAQAGEAQAGAALARARTSLGYTQVRAPFAGIVTAKAVDAGALATPGMLLFTVEDTHRYRLESTIDESDIHIIRVGRDASVAIDSLGNARLAGKIAEIVPTADPSSHSFFVKIDLPAAAGIRSGLFGRARFTRGERQALLIPRAAVVEKGQLTGVYVVDANRIAQLRYVTLRSNSSEQDEVLSGLKEGETLVAAPGDRDFGGKRIAPQP